MSYEWSSDPASDYVQAKTPKPTPEERLPAGYLNREQREDIKRRHISWNEADSLLKHGESADLLLEQKDREIARLSSECPESKSGHCNHEEFEHDMCERCCNCGAISDLCIERRVSNLRRLLEECATALTFASDMIDTHVNFPEPCHEGACGPESGCDSICAELASMAENLLTIQRVIAKFQAAGIGK